ncbi:hypothetical protein PVAND_010396 [Polypedilum vanderplanki]|uniref:C2H2-type domain-containing protein n=1 Tax=Polypedilum vanderplanki TaxID=319348 RepID=A0A9J6CGH1_POLVA|nr:hypothetical protein PVAND_010396 [Polypedilum vanderplanki]
MEKVVYIENCMICGLLLNENKNELTLTTQFTEKPIFQLIEEFTNIHFSDEIINEGGVCSDCFNKFNEYDQYSTLAIQTKQELVALFENSSSNCNNQPIEEEEGDAIVEEEIEGVVEIEDEILTGNIVEEEEEEFITHETVDIGEQTEVIDLIEVSYLDTDKLPKKFQNPEVKEKILKTKSIKVKNEEDGTTIVQLDNNIKLFQCNICQRSFKEKSKLKAHLQIHTTERNVFCPICNKSFKTAACLRSHKRVHNPTIIECDYCGKNYTQKPELIKHIKFVHFNRRDFVCEICNAGFGCKGHLKAHYLTHQQFKGISCSVCGYSFHTQAKLQRHMRSHSGQRDYECNICKKRFLYSYNVSAHIRHVHWKEKRKTDDNTRTCTFCNKKFQTVWKLKQHMQEEHHVIETEIDETNVDYEELVEA